MTNPGPEGVLKLLIEELVDNSDCVRIECNETRGTAVIDVYVHKEDVGLVLGRGGAHAEAIRTIFKTMYHKMGKRLYLQVSELTE